MTYLTSPLTESQAQQVDSIQEITGLSLDQMEGPINSERYNALWTARRMRDQKYWQDRAREEMQILDGEKKMTEEDRLLVNAVWDKMPGSTSFMDALRLIARNGLRPEQKHEPRTNQAQG